MEMVAKVVVVSLIVILGAILVVDAVLDFVGVWGDWGLDR